MSWCPSRTSETFTPSVTTACAGSVMANSTPARSVAGRTRNSSKKSRKKGLGKWYWAAWPLLASGPKT